MSHSKGLFAGTCPGRWVKHGPAWHGVQQWKCSKCGLLRQARPRPCLFHSWGRSRRDPVLRCRKCGRQK